jgi:hypothetical protein
MVLLSNWDSNGTFLMQQQRRCLQYLKRACPWCVFFAVLRRVYGCAILVSGKKFLKKLKQFLTIDNLFFKNNYSSVKLCGILVDLILVRITPLKLNARM